MRKLNISHLKEFKRILVLTGQIEIYDVIRKDLNASGRKIGYHCIYKKKPLIITHNNKTKILIYT